MDVPGDNIAVMAAQEDADVAAERTRVLSTDDTDDVIRLCNLRKQYGGSTSPVRLPSHTLLLRAHCRVSTRAMLSL